MPNFRLTLRFRPAFDIFMKTAGTSTSRPAGAA
jgi:hypothetical protein